MVVLRVSFFITCGLGVGGCIESNSPRFADVPTDSTQPAETVDETSLDSGAEIEVEPQCRSDEACPQPVDPCRETVCSAGICDERYKDDEAPCDDGNPCTGDGVCRLNACVDAQPVQNGRSCDDGLVCNGERLCEDGICSIAIAPTCGSSGAPCAGGAVCSEESGGICVDTPAAYGTPCEGPLDAGMPAQWVCSELRCVPPDMVALPTASFTMGCPVGYCSADNGPAHTVRVSAFAIDRTEVTEEEWLRCIEDADDRGFRCAPRAGENPGDVSTLPVRSPLLAIDWARAEQVCSYQGKRLCTEAEWEHAARGTGEAFYPWGNLPPTCERTTFFSEGGPGCNTGKPSLVDTKPLGASEAGALHMSGNVAEWVVDYYDPDLYAARAEAQANDPNAIAIDPAQRESLGVESHVVRGGSFRDGLALIRVFVRSAQPSEVTRDDLGVRCCVSLGEP